AGLWLHVLPGVLGEVGVVSGEISPEEARCDFLELVHVDRPEAQDLRRVPEDVALDDVVRVIRQLLREARVPEASQQRVPVAQARRAGRRTRRETGCPRVAQPRLV